MTKQRTSSHGFTLIEIIVVATLFIILGIVFFIQFSNLEAKNRDDKRKTSINAMYYTLEEVYHPANGYYPVKISVESLPSVPEEALKDVNGVMVGTKDSEFRYEPKNCTDNKCQSYTLRTTLEKEDDFIKKSRHK